MFRRPPSPLICPGSAVSSAERHGGVGGRTPSGERLRGRGEEVLTGASGSERSRRISYRAVVGRKARTSQENIPGIITLASDICGRVPSMLRPATPQPAANLRPSHERGCCSCATMAQPRDHRRDGGQLRAAGDSRRRARRSTTPTSRCGSRRRPLGRPSARSAGGTRARGSALGRALAGGKRRRRDLGLPRAGATRPRGGRRVAASGSHTCRACRSSAAAGRNASCTQRK